MGILLFSFNFYNGFKISFAARSAIAIIMVLGVPETGDGNMLPSITLSPLIPLTLILRKRKLKILKFKWQILLFCNYFNSLSMTLPIAQVPP